MIGTYKDKVLAATSTGMGPSTAIAVEELARVKVPLILVGSSAVVQNGSIPGIY